MRSLTTIAAGIAALFLTTTDALDISFENKCTYAIQLYDNAKTNTIAPKGSTRRTISRGFHGMYRHTSNPQATLVEITIDNNQGWTWYDISVIPPGPGYCKSYDDCKQFTKKTGYNVPLSIIPVSSEKTPECRAVTCERANCPDGYLYPKDDTKTHVCKSASQFKVVFCPNGPGQKTGARMYNPLDAYDSGKVKPAEGARSLPQPAKAKSSFTYHGKLAGNMPGTYQMITNPKSCSRQSTSVKSSVGPMSEEVTMIFRGPMTISNIAVFDGSSGGDWKRVSSYSSNGATQDMVFMNNKNIDYTGGGKSPQGYATSDGLGKANGPTPFSGKLAEASDPSKIGGGPGIQTGAEVNIMRQAKCSADKNCKGYYDDNGHHGWGGGKKMFVTKVHMPNGKKPNQPAIWMLNAQIVRSSQYQCNCRGMGRVGGCGELDIAEVIETNPARDRVSTHYYFYDGSVPSGRDNYAPRPTNGTTTYLTIIDDSGEGTIKILEIGANDFDFSASKVSSSQIKQYLSMGN